jgi:protein involved in polysaccharide export with SLBB domain
MVTGCAAPGPPLDRALLANQPSAASPADLTAHYLVHCPDILQITVTDHPDWGGLLPVRLDGEITLNPGGRLRVDGRTIPEIARSVAALLGVPTAGVQVAVAEYRSQHVLLFGEVAGQERTVPYQGPETVLALLRRVGGITPGAAPSDVQVVRSHVADGKAPEVFHIDLEAILLKNDPKTNVTLEPLDQVYVGQTRRSRLTTCFPPWLRPLYEGLCGMRP